MRTPTISRRDFVKYTGLIGAGAAALWVGERAPSWAAGGQTLHLHITDALKDMITNNDTNRAQCYFWLYQPAGATKIPAEVPGPDIIAFEGDTVTVDLNNALDEDHNWAIPAAGIFSPTIKPGGGAQFSFTVPPAGLYLYYDSLNAPVNRVMGLHGAFVSMPSPATGTPYNSAAVAANPNMARLFADFGTAAHFPGLAWDEGATNPGFPDTPAFRQYIWVLHTASSKLFAEVGQAPKGVDFDAATFVDKFLNDPLVVQGNANTPPVKNDTPDYFTVSGQSGHESHDNPFISPALRVGEPCLIRVLNAGLWSHSLHIHANHMYVLQVNNQFSFQPDVGPGQTDNHFWIDTWPVRPLDTFDWGVPYMRPPDVPNTRGIGFPDQPLHSGAPPIGKFGDGPNNETPPANDTWPPVQEVHMATPPPGTTIGGFPEDRALSPICYPSHDHSEPTQTAQGGNYNQGMIGGIDFSGDRTIDPAGPVTFPHAPTVFGPQVTTNAAGPEPPWPEIDQGSI
jgi:FtsP/CotA-like multicopper oxidase with cupredoxin domain